MPFAEAVMRCAKPLSEMNTPEASPSNALPTSTANTDGEASHVAASTPTACHRGEPATTPNGSQSESEATMRAWATAAEFPPLLAEGERYYLRSVGLDPRKQPADFPSLFPDLAAECHLLPRGINRTAEDAAQTGATEGADGAGGCTQRPQLLDASSYHSSVLRLASDGTQLWAHFDTLDNALAQVTGCAGHPPVCDARIQKLSSAHRVLRKRVEGAAFDQHNRKGAYRSIDRMRRWIRTSRLCATASFPALSFHRQLAPVG